MTQPAPQNEQQLLEQAVVKLNSRVLGFIFGFIFGAGLFLATIFLVIKGGPVTGPHLALLSQYFPGYSVTFLGSVVGFVYAFAIGFAIGMVLGAVYNKVAHA